MQTNRRGVLLGGICCACCTSTIARSQTLIDLGCGINEVDAKAILGSSRSVAREYIENLVTNTSGNEDFDSTFGVVLSEIAVDFGVFPGFHYFEDFGLRQAWASPARFTENSDGTILLGKSLVLDAMAHGGGESAILAISAHEFAHIAAYQREDAMLRATHGRPRYAGELHADFLAGYFLAKYERSFRNINLVAPGRLWLGFGSTNPNEPGTHGTMAMRRNSINAGYRWSKDQNRQPAFDDAFSAASSFIQTV